MYLDKFYKLLFYAYLLEQSLACGLVFSEADIAVEQNIPWW